MFIIRCDNSKLDPYWLKMYLSSSVGKQILSAALTGDKIKVMTKESLANLNILDIAYQEQILASNEYRLTLEKLKNTKKQVLKLKNDLENVCNDKFKLFDKNLDFDKQDIINFDTSWETAEEEMVIYFLTRHYEDYSEFIDDFMVIFNSNHFWRSKEQVLEKCDQYKKARSRNEIPLIMKSYISLYESVETNSNYSIPLNKNILEEGKSSAKHYIKSLLRVCGYLDDEEITLASLNKTVSNVFWATPKKDFLTKDWFIALNDYKNHKLHILRIPANEQGLTFKSRKDDETRLHFEVLIEDTNYIERKSGLDLTKYLFKVFNY